MIKALAFIGLGGQSQGELIPAALSLSNSCQIVAICDINQNFVDAAKKLLPDPEAVKVFGDYNDLLKEVQSGKLHLDGVVASVPHFLYWDIIAKFVAAGVPVFKEKPFALNLAEAKKISQLALRENVQIYTVAKRQFYASYTKGAQLLLSGEIGTPYMYSARHFIPHGNLYSGWRSSVEAAGGGVFMDMGYHLLDVLLRYFGEMNKASLRWSHIAKPEYTYEVEDAATLATWHATGVHGVFQLAALSGPKEEQIEIRGTKGRMVVTKDSVTLYDVMGEETQKLALKTDGVTATAEALARFLLNDKSIWSMNLSHSMRIMRVIDMAYKKRFT